jgi:hypothetical protein
MIELPVYQTKLPIQDKTVEFSPLVVKEEKNIAIAKETGSKSDSYVTFLRILEDKFKIKPSSLCQTDLIHCIIELRKKSISEEVRVRFKCPHSNQTVDTKFQCDDITLKGSGNIKNIKTSDYIIELQTPLSDDLSSAIISIETPKQKMDFLSIPDKKKKEIVDSLPINIHDKIKKGIEDLFHYEFSLTYTTDSEHTIEVRSAEDFFTLFFVM